MGREAIEGKDGSIGCTYSRNTIWSLGKPAVLFTPIGSCFYMNDVSVCGKHTCLVK